MIGRTNYQGQPHDDYRFSRTVTVCSCCSAPIETRGNFGDYWKACSSCGFSDIYGLVPLKVLYYPSSFEEELESKIEALEKHMLSLAQSIEKLVDKLSGKDIPGLPGRY